MRADFGVKQIFVSSPNIRGESRVSEAALVLLTHRQACTWGLL